MAEHQKYRMGLRLPHSLVMTVWAILSVEVTLAQDITVDLVLPAYGPQAGGTRVVLTGGNFSTVTDVQISCDGATVMDYNTDTHNRSTDTVMQFYTTNVSLDHVGVECEINLVTNSNDTIIETGKNFTFKPNPIVEDIQPRKSIISGGIPFTVTGSNFDSVFLSELRMLFEIEDKEYEQPGEVGYRDAAERAADFCKIESSTLMYCPTKTLRNHGNRQLVPNPLTGTLNSEHLKFHVGVILDGVKDYLRFSAMDMYQDPEFDRFDDDPLPFKIYKGDTTIAIYGNNFLHGFQVKDFEISIGQGVCEVTGDVLTNHLKCKPPDDQPENQDIFSYADHPRIWATVGRVTSDVGEVRYEKTFWDDPQVRLAIIVTVCVLGVLIIFIPILVVCLCKKRGHGREPLISHRGNTRYTKPPGLWDRVPSDLQRQLQPCLKQADRLRLGAELSHGNFGAVHAGKYLDVNEATVLVAAKTIKETGVTPDELREFLDEAIIMKNLDNVNVLKLVGVVIKEGRPYILLPFMENGSLKDFLQNPNNAFTVSDLLEYGVQVSMGMSYVAKADTVHRDLAARNCLISKDNVVKIADFGLARLLQQDSEYYKISSNTIALPIKWMAPESIDNKKFTWRSDVWSFGVLLWELLTRCKKPYAHVDNFDLKRFLLSGRRLENPTACPDQVYNNIMLQCWDINPMARPTFDSLTDSLGTIVTLASQDPGGHTSVDYSQSSNGTDVLGLYQNLTRYVDFATDRPYERISRVPAVDVPADVPPDGATAAEEDVPMQDGYLNMGGLDYKGAGQKFDEIEKPELDDGYLQSVPSDGNIQIPAPDYHNMADNKDSGYLKPRDMQNGARGNGHRGSAGSGPAPHMGRQGSADGSYMNVAYQNSEKSGHPIKSGEVVINMSR